MKRLLVLLVPLALLAAGCSKGGDDVVVSVNGNDVLTADDFEDQLNEIADDPNFLTTFDGRGSGHGDSTLSSAFVATVLSNHVLNELLRQDLAERGVEVTDNDVQRGSDQLAQALGGDIEAAPPSYRALLVDLFGNVVALRRALHESGETLDDEVQGLFDGAEVEIDPRYGHWDAADQEVAPPDGPLEPTTTAPSVATAPPTTAGG